MINEKDLIELVESITELDNLNMQSELEEDSWDSLAVISFIAAINTKYEKVLNADSIGKVKTINDLFDLVNE